MTEYWLQKKTIGGWSHVTWYADKDEALKNLHNAAVPLNGYSWRLCEINVIEQINLEDHTEPEPPEIEVKKTSWGAIIETPKQTVVDYGNEKPKRAWGQNNNSWSDSWDKSKFKGNDFPSDSSKPEHGLTGSVWVIHHQQKIKKRIAASEVDSYLAQGYERGGPKTAYRE